MSGKGSKSRKSSDDLPISEKESRTSSSETSSKKKNSSKKPTSSKPIDDQIGTYDIFDYKLDLEASLIQKFLQSTGFIKNSIESFNHMISFKIPNLIKSEKFHYLGITGQFFRPTIVKPSVSDSINRKNEEILFPQKCRQEALTYSAKLFVDLKLTNQKGSTYVTKGIFLGKFHAMVGSKICYLHGLSPNERVALGEGASDVEGGYFIQGGLEKVVTLDESLMRNRVFTYIRSKNLVSAITSKGTVGTKTTTIHLPSNKEELKKNMPQEVLIKINSFFEPVNIIMIFAFLAGSIDNHSNMYDFMYGLISSLCKKELFNKVWTQFQQTMKQFNSKINQEENGYQKALATAADYPNFDDKFASSLQLNLDENLLIHIEDPDVRKRNYEKIFFLGYMLVGFLETLIGERKIDNRDLWGNKESYDAATIYFEYLLEKLFRRMCGKLRTHLRNKEPNDLSEDKFLAAAQSIRSNVDSSIITNGLDFAMATGKFGLGNTAKRVGMCEIMNRLSSISQWSHLTRYSLSVGDGVRQIEPRLVSESQMGYICPFETPDGKKTGLNRNAAITCIVTIDADPTILIERLEKFMSPIITDSLGDKKMILLNGRIIGWGNPQKIREEVIKIRREGDIYIHTSVYIDSNETCIVSTCSGRVTRPLLIVENGQACIVRDDKWEKSWTYLTSNGYVEYIDALEQQSCYISQKIEYLNGTLEKLYKATKDYDKSVDELNNAKLNSSGLSIISELERNVEQSKKTLELVRKERGYTHCEIDPIACVGIAGSLIPMLERNHGPRNQYAINMMKQAMSLYHTNYRRRPDTTARLLVNPTRPLNSAYTERMFGISNTPMGDNIILGILPVDGRSQEDAIIINKTSSETGKFRMQIRVTYRSIAKKHFERFGVPADKRKVEEEKKPKKSKFEESGKSITQIMAEKKKAEEEEKKRQASDKNFPYRFLDPTTGIIRPGVSVSQGDCIIGKIAKDQRTGEEHNVSLFVGKGDEGYIEDVIISMNSDWNMVVKVVMSKYYTDQLGDKYTPRNANKATESIKMKKEDMPFTEDGVTPDAIINPLSMPTRMTIGMLFESFSNWKAIATGRRIENSSFRDFEPGDFQRYLLEAGLNRHGNASMIMGTTGEYIEADIFIGIVYYMALKHRTSEKIQWNTRSKVKADTRQPVKGRQLEGGLRFGLMEVDALLSHGARYVLEDRMLKSSDGYKFVLCTGCKQIVYVNAKESTYECKTCTTGEPSSGVYGKIEIPYSFKLLTDYLGVMGIKTTFESKERK